MRSKTIRGGGTGQESVGHDFSLPVGSRTAVLRSHGAFEGLDSTGPRANAGEGGDVDT